MSTNNTIFLLSALTIVSFITYETHKIFTSINNTTNSIQLIDNKINDLLKINTEILQLLDHSNTSIKVDVSSQTNLEKEEVIIPIVEPIIKTKEEMFDDNELLDVCYTNLPCNNAKNCTGFNKLFNWNK